MEKKSSHTPTLSDDFVVVLEMTPLYEGWYDAKARLEIALNCHEELLQLIKTAYCIVAEAMPEQAPDPSAFVVVQKNWLKQAEQALAKAVGEA